MRLRVALALTGLAACVARRDPPRPGSSTQAIQSSVVDDEHRYAMGVCLTNDGPGRCSEVCSGALILPNVVATARHCVSTSAEVIDCRTTPRFGAARAGTLWATTRTTMDTDGGTAGWYEVDEVRVPADDRVCGNDLALLVLKASVPDVTPVIPGVQYVMSDRDRYSATFTAIGYGVTTPKGSDSGVRRRLDLVSVLCIPGEAECGDDVDVKEFQSGTGTCSGDSGSSALERGSFLRGEPVSFGVLSRGSVSGPDCELSFFTRFDAHRDFVLEVAREASAEWSRYPEPSWTEEKPRPSRLDASVDAPATNTPEAGPPPAPPAAAPPAGEGCNASGAASSPLALLAVLVLGRRRRLDH